VKNKYNPSLKLAHDLARIFGVAIEELFLFDN
jgi:DNA-binding XRE family transcriptional regulator